MARRRHFFRPILQLQVNQLPPTPIPNPFHPKRGVFRGKLGPPPPIVKKNKKQICTNLIRQKGKKGKNSIKVYENKQLCHSLLYLYFRKRGNPHPTPPWNAEYAPAIQNSIYLFLLGQPDPLAGRVNHPRHLFRTQHAILFLLFPPFCEACLLCTLAGPKLCVIELSRHNYWLLVLWLVRW